MLALQPPHQGKGGQDRQQTKKHRAKRLPRHHPPRAKPAGTEVDCRNGAQQRPAEIEGGGPVGAVQVVETGIGDKQQAVEHKGAHQEMAIEQDQLPRHATGGKSADDEIGAQQQHKPYRSHVHDIEKHRVRQGGAHPVVAPGTGILPHDGAYRAGQGEYRRHCQGRDAAHDSGTRHSAVAKTGHGNQHETAADGGGDVGQYRRGGNSHYRPQVGQELRHTDPAGQTVHHRERMPGNQQNHQARDDRGERGPLQAPAEGEDEKGVQHGVDERAQHRRPHGAAGISQRPHPRGSAHTQHQYGHAGQHDAGIAHGVSQGLVPRPEQGEQGRQVKPADGTDNGRQQEVEGHGAAAVALGEVPPVCALGPGDQGAQRDLQADAHRDQEEQQGSRKPHGGRQFLLPQQGEKVHIDHIHGEHRHQACRTGAGHGQHVAHGRALQKHGPAGRAHAQGRPRVAGSQESTAGSDRVLGGHVGYMEATCLDKPA